MADNYLERKMEEYRSGKLAIKPKTSFRPGSLRPATGFDVAVVGGKRVLICGDCLEGIGHELMKFFRSIGCKVAFCDIDARRGTAIAQSSGCRFYPFDFNDESKLEAVKADLYSRWGGVDILADVRVNAKF